MFDNILQRMRNKVRTGAYVMTLHADEEIDAEELSVFDVERCVLTGKIIERQKIGKLAKQNIEFLDLWLVEILWKL